MLDDDRAVVTVDGRLSCYFENTVAQETGPRGADATAIHAAAD